MKPTLIASATALIFLVIGIVCLFWPERIQQFGLDYYLDHKTAAKLNPFLDWMKTRGYILSLRIIGVMAIGASGLTLFVIVRGLYK